MGKNIGKYLTFSIVKCSFVHKLFKQSNLRCPPSRARRCNRLTYQRDTYFGGLEPFVGKYNTETII